MLQLQHVSKAFGDAVAVHPTDLTVQAGQTTALLGQSGCGKSTLLRMIIGLIAPDSGSVVFEGAEITPENVLEHALAYRALDSGKIDVTDLYTTDAEIEYYDLVALEDDRNHFPRYHAVWLYRIDLEERCPAAVKALKRLEGRIDRAAMINMNRQRAMDGVAEEEVAADFLKKTFGLNATRRSRGLVERTAQRTYEHLMLVGISLSAAIVFAIPGGILAARWPTAGKAILSVVGIVQTVPSLVLLILMIPLLGVGAPPAIAALFLYRWCAPDASEWD